MHTSHMQRRAAATEEQTRIAHDIVKCRVMGHLALLGMAIQIGVGDGGYRFAVPKTFGTILPEPKPHIYLAHARGTAREPAGRKRNREEEQQRAR